MIYLGSMILISFILHKKNFIFCLIWSNLLIYYFSSISFRFWSWGGINYQLQSLIQFYQFYPRLFQVKIFLYSLSWCVPESTTHLGCFVIPNQSHTSISFFDYMCSRIDHLKWSPRLWAPIIQFIKFSESMVCNILLNQFKSISLIKFNLFHF